MEIKTKYNLLEQVWFMWFTGDSKVHKGDIQDISIKVSAKLTGAQKEVFYTVKDFKTSIIKELPEYALFPTKEELLKSL